MVTFAFTTVPAATAAVPRSQPTSAPVPGKTDRKRVMSDSGDDGVAVAGPRELTCPKSPYLRVLKRVRSKPRKSSTTATLEKLREEKEVLDKQRAAYQRQYERIHSGTAPVAVPPRSVKSLTVVSPRDGTCNVSPARGGGAWCRC